MLGNDASDRRAPKKPVALRVERSVPGMNLLRAGNQPAASPSGGLELDCRAASQAEYHRPTQLVHALVQRHFYLTEGAVGDGVGEPMPESGSSPRHHGLQPSEYQQLVRRRAADTSRAIKAEQDAQLQLAQAKYERLQAARDYGVRVAVGNARVLLAKSAAKAQQAAAPSPAQQADGGQAGGAGAKGRGRAGGGAAAAAGRPEQRPSQPEVPPPPPVAAKQLSRKDHMMLEKEHYKPPAKPAPPKEPEPEPEPTPAEPAPAGPPPPPASVSARLRLLSHCPSAAALSPLPATPASGLRPSTALAAPAVQPLARGEAEGQFRTRVLQLANTNSSPAPGKLHHGRPLPTAVSVSDTTGLARIAAKVAEMGSSVVLPRPCCCPNTTSLFDPKYVFKCARNCQLYGKPERYETLMTGLLRGADII